MIEIKITADTGLAALAEMKALLQGQLAQGVPAVTGDVIVLERDVPVGAGDAAKETAVVANIPAGEKDEAAPAEKPKRGRKAKAEAPQPEPAPAPEPQPQPEPDPQDAADEAADEGSALTLDDLRDALMRYGHTYGMENCTLDLTPIFKKHGRERLSGFADADQETLQAALDDIEDAIETNPNGRKAHS